MQLTSINITGTDALAFLQGQLSNDLTRLETDAEILAAWCNPKGRVIWFGSVRRLASGYGLTAPAETAQDIVKRLLMYRFRSKVDFEVEAGEDLDERASIRAGLPVIAAAQSEQFTPHMLNLDLLDAVSFDKGCYTGQEIVARTHYKGATKRRMLRFESERPLAPGDKIMLGDREIGEVLNASGQDLLAVVPIREAQSALTVAGSPLVLQTLPYLQLPDLGQ